MTIGPGNTPDDAPAQSGDPASPLQQRLQAALDWERSRNELQAELREQRRTAEEQDSIRRVEALEEALAEVRAEISKREEVEQKLGRVRLEAAKLAVEAGQAKREAEEAERQRAQIQRDFDAASVQTEGQLKQLRAEADEAQRTLERERALRGVEPEPLVGEPEEREAGLEPPIAVPAPQGRFGRRRRKRMFDSRGRTCAVCHHTEVSSPGALNAAGWALGAEIDLCPDCQEQGWQLPKGGSLPFRRSSSRQG